MATADNLFDELLVNAIIEYPVLYEIGKKSNKNKTAKDNAWKVIADELKTTRTYHFKHF
jgi:hypothetical protein